MQSGDKGLKGKEMCVPDGNKMGQIQCAERDSGGEQRENTPEVGLRVCRRRIRNRVELAAMEIEGLGPTAIEGAGAARRPKSASWFPDSSTARSRSRPFGMASAGDFCECACVGFDSFRNSLAVNKLSFAAAFDEACFTQYLEVV